jgi:hypothetical protein
LERCRRRLLLHLPLLLLRVPRMPFPLLRGPPRMRPLRLPERGGIPRPPLPPRFAGPDPVVPPPPAPRGTGSGRTGGGRGRERIARRRRVARSPRRRDDHRPGRRRRGRPPPAVGVGRRRGRRRREHDAFFSVLGVAGDGARFVI